MSNPNRKYKVVLTQEQRERLENIRRNGRSPAKKILHAQVLLMADQEHPRGRWTDAQISDALGIHINIVAKIRRRFVFEGEIPALNRRQRITPPLKPILDGKAHAHLVAICCSSPPCGRTHWTIELLVNELKGRKIVTQISRETVRLSLNRMNYVLGKSKDIASPKVMPPDS